MKGRCSKRDRLGWESEGADWRAQLQRHKRAGPEPHCTAAGQSLRKPLEQRQEPTIIQA